jgi:diguanylate cyclase (GGDEF)-like protein
MPPRLTPSHVSNEFQALRRWRIHRFLDRQPQWRLAVAVAALLLAVAALDLLTGPDIGFSYFFWIPVGFAAWFVGRPAGVLASVSAALLWLGANSLSGAERFIGWVGFWNGSIRFAYFATFAVIVSYLRATLPALNEALARERSLARHDSLTGVLNGRAFREAAHREILRLGRYGGSLVVAFIDLDDFKSVNDRFGHAAGDDLLRTIATLVSDRLRRTDIVARAGGDEFVILLPQTGIDEARPALESIRTMISALDCGDGQRVSVSIGAVAADSSFDGDTETLLRRADALMYSVKRSGKDAIEVEELAGPLSPSREHRGNTLLELP